MHELLETISKAAENQEKPFAVFDFDNTCIVNDIGEAVFAHLCRNKLLKDRAILPSGDGEYHERVFKHYYALLEEGDIVTAYLLAAQVLSGFTLEEIGSLVSETLVSEGTEIQKTELFGIAITKGIRVRPEIPEMFDFLQENGIAIWVVSASPEATVRAAMQYFNLPGTAIGLRNETDGAVLTADIKTPYSISDGKIDCIQTSIDPVQRPVFAIGDSMNDFPMLEYSRSRAVVDRKNELSRIAAARGWPAL